MDEIGMDDMESRIDDALKTYPLAATPSGFTQRVMSQVRLQQAQAVFPTQALRPPELVFRLEFLDIAIPAFFALFATLGLVTVLWAYISVDPVRFLELRLTAQAILALAPVRQAMIWLLAVVGLAGLLVAAILALLFWQTPWLARVKVLGH